MTPAAPGWPRRCGARERIGSLAGALVLFLHGLAPVGVICFAGELPGLLKASGWPPPGEALRIPVAADTWVSSAGDERFGNNGGASRLKVKGRQEYSLIDIDPGGLAGRRITGALLHLRAVKPQEAPLARLGVSSLAAPWAAGSASGYRPQAGGACFAFAKYPDAYWSYAGSTLVDVCFGRGHTRWRFADCSAPNEGGWQSCAVDPDVIAARVAGLSHGFVLYDEVGNEWSIKEGRFDYRYFPNRFLYSTESGRSAPWLEVWVSGEDREAPNPVSELSWENRGLPPGQAMVRWRTPADRGGGRTLGFFVSVQGKDETFAVPQYLVPMAGKPGEEVRMHLRDLSLPPGEEITLAVRAVDNAGNASGPVETRVVPSGVETCALPAAPKTLSSNAAIGEGLEVGGVRVAVVDLLDKIDPVGGALIPAAPAAYRRANHLFSADRRTVRLHAARNEHVAFQIDLEGAAPSIRIECRFASPDVPLRARLYEFGYVRTGEKRAPPLPDPLPAGGGETSLPSRRGSVPVKGQSHHSLICEVYVPHRCPPGEQRGQLVVSAGRERLVIDLALRVWGFTLPDKLSFVPEMNAYGTVFPNTDGYRYYRLAHEHRTCLNRLPYNWGGRPAFAPRWRPGTQSFDWAAWESQVAPLLDGRAFRDLPRGGQPVDVFYLPFNENWPASLFDHYRPSYWADEAFGEAYRRELAAAFGRFGRRCREKGWQDTIFQFYLNNKVYYREKFLRSSAPWIFDEPVNTQDFWALRWYGRLWQEAVAPFKGDCKLLFRGDISYYPFSRDMLRGIMDVVYLGGADAQTARMMQDEQALFGKSYWAEYGSPNKIEDSNLQPVLWCLAAWCRGAMGVLPWQTIGSKDCWERAEQTALFYPHPSTHSEICHRLPAWIMRESTEVEGFPVAFDVFVDEIGKNVLHLPSIRHS